MKNNTHPIPGSNYLIITAHHDYRTPRRANSHFIADELKKIGSVRFFSLRYSNLSKHKGDFRISLDSQSNKIEIFNDVECFLWKTKIHPFNMKKKFLQPLESFLFWMYQYLPTPTLKKWIIEADTIIYESGIASIFFESAKKINPNAKHIYLASDDLETINTSQYAIKRFLKNSKNMDAICLAAKAMEKNIPHKSNLYYIPHGLNDDLNNLGDPSPYNEGVHAVSVGSMLFDSSYFEIASHVFPEVTFHVIGSGHADSSKYGNNVKVYGHMAYNETIKYIKHATIGIAPYIAEAVPEYLADSSMKMLQYDYFSIPTVCPHNVTGNYPSRFGYSPGNVESIIKATRHAIEAPHKQSRQILSWAEVTERIINPSIFPDTQIITSKF